MVTLALTADIYQAPNVFPPIFLVFDTFGTRDHVPYRVVVLSLEVNRQISVRELELCPS